MHTISARLSTPRPTYLDAPTAAPAAPLTPASGSLTYDAWIRDDWVPLSSVRRRAGPPQDAVKEPRELVERW